MDKDNYNTFSHTNELKSNSFSDLKKISYDGWITKAKVVDVYDGDTVTIVFYRNDMPIKSSFRLYGYDSPELKPTKKCPNRDLHIKAGIIAKQYLSNEILNKIVWIKFCGDDKYGRLMGNIYRTQNDEDSELSEDNVCVNDTMIKNGYGLPYHGGRKTLFTTECLNKIVNCGKI